jgi:hypothetical protein
MRPDKMSLSQHRFLFVYGVTLVLCFSPLKPLAFISPLLVILLLIFFVQAKPLYNLVKLAAFLFLYACIGLLYFFANKDFLWLNFAFWLLTNSSYLLFIVSFSDLIDANLMRRMVSLTFKILLLEASLGIIQVLFNVIFITHGFDGGTGDAAMGTVNPTFGAGDGKGSNVYYAIGLSALGTLVFLYHKYQQKKVPSSLYAVLIIGWVAASVMHSIFLLIAAILISIFVFISFTSKKKSTGLGNQMKAVRKISLGVIIVFICLFTFLPGNVSLLRNYYDQSFGLENLKSTKSIASVVTVLGLSQDKPFQKYVGLGPGQYCSKAGMILSGTYLGQGKLQVIKSLSPDLNKYILPIWLEYLSWDFQAGSTYFPFFSWLSLYGEFGILGWVIVLAGVIFACKKIISLTNKSNIYLILGLLIILFYLFLLGIQDNYWEWSQFVLPIVIFAKTVYYLAKKSDQLSNVSTPGLEGK